MFTSYPLLEEDNEWIISVEQSKSNKLAEEKQYAIQNTLLTKLHKP